jgi:predicted dehydrogenase
MRLGIIGLGHLGKIHLRCAIESGCWQVSGYHEIDDTAAQAVQVLYPDLVRFATHEALIEASDAAVVVTPTPTHYEIARKVIGMGKHVFIEKPITETIVDARKLVQMAHKAAVKIQIGHVERFNPAFLALQHIPLRPRFVEVHRLAYYQPRGTDVSVVLDLMIHDLDLVLHLMGDQVKRVSANGVRLLSGTEDIVNARLEMRDGSVANITASRVSLKPMRKVRIFQDDAYVSMDFLEKKSDVVRLKNEPFVPELMSFGLETQDGTKYIQVESVEVKPLNAIKEELIAFHAAIKQDTAPIVTGEDGLAALVLAHRIIKAVSRV